ncbi:hypothetical protein EVAR_19531_1 [Eumeta japonica]|uniref:ATP-dependent DNA helicase n=1 Tax=Eumeta variegata TaxID=151549 RepID=A0A4C1UF14_EUMVA|nr:hypothetical protein EVAR_19531_1 [Eumeta japonica]
MLLIHFGMLSPNRPATDIINSEIQREQQFDTVSLTTFVENNEQLLTDERKNVYDQINLSIAVGQGIATALLDGGRTAHSALELPLNIHTNSDAVCNIKKNSENKAKPARVPLTIGESHTRTHGFLHRIDRSQIAQIFLFHQFKETSKRVQARRRARGRSEVQSSRVNNVTRKSKVSRRTLFNLSFERRMQLCGAITFNEFQNSKRGRSRVDGAGRGAATRGPQPADSRAGGPGTLGRLRPL